MGLFYHYQYISYHRCFICHCSLRNSLYSVIPEESLIIPCHTSWHILYILSCYIHLIHLLLVEGIVLLIYHSGICLYTLFRTLCRGHCILSFIADCQDILHLVISIYIIWNILPRTLHQDFSSWLQNQTNVETSQMSHQFIFTCLLFCRYAVSCHIASNTSRGIYCQGLCKGTYMSGVTI